MPSIALANGCFDVLHIGHIEHLKAASQLAEILIVALTSDNTMREEKGEGRPIHCFADREKMLKSFGFVSQVVPSDYLPSVIEKIKPSVLVKGQDWLGKIPDDVLQACVANGTTIAFTMTRKLSSSSIIARMGVV